MASERRLNWGCGEHVAPGWINCDVSDGPRVDLVADLREGLPIATGSLDYAVSVQALAALTYPDLFPALLELRRVLKPGGVLRLALPDLDRAIDAYRRGAHFTAELAEGLLREAGFEPVRAAAFGKTASEFPAIVELDDRGDESFFVEAWKPLGDAAPEIEPGELRVLEVAQGGGERVKGQFRIRATEEPRLEIIGWAVGLEAAVVEVEVLSGELLAGRTVPDLERPEVGERFPGVAGAARSGFRLELAAQGVGESELRVRAGLEDGSRELLGVVVVQAARRVAARAGR